MTENQKIDIDFIKDKLTFEKIQIQKSIFIELFTEIANHYPQSDLAKHPFQAKGTKVSQGTNLENCPYQVLDIIRNFDPLMGLNIRILNWWGHGLYIFVQFGREIAAENEEMIFDKLSEFYTSASTDPFDYKTILTSKKRLIRDAFKDHLESFSSIVLYKEIYYRTNLAEQKEVLLENINLILDKGS